MTIDPHENRPEENPMEHIGGETQDPWDDPKQTDWPNEVIEVHTGVPAAAKGVAHVEEV